jgi:putative ABC transport system ATP-binding protein
VTEPLSARSDLGQTTAPGETAIELTGVTRRFASGVDVVWAVRGVTLRVSYGEFTCVLGASGSGKTTLLNLIAGLDKPDAGSVYVGGHDLTRLSEADRSRLRLTEIGVVFQDHNLIEEFTAVENVMLPLEVAGVSGAEARRQSELLLNRVGLAGLSGRLPSQLSGGQKQRVGIARALIGRRRILLADEPTGALDSANSRALFSLFSDLSADGLCVLLVTHDPLSRGYVDSAHEMTDGQLQEVAQLREVT